jgi:gamma-glutamylcyclotransferase (GGCT)/AIG2-like uncharacterized protein YtfP
VGETEVFVYGTLVPGGRYYDVVAAVVVAHRPARVHGRLFDTGRGYPAAMFDDGPAEISGVVLTLSDAQRSLARLDRFEGDEYVRREVVTTNGDSVWSYEWQSDLAGFAEVQGGVWL